MKRNIKLENVMYMNIINDVSCLVDGKIIVLAEHQSTINENMPRQGMYFRVHSLTASFRLAPKTSRTDRMSGVLNSDR